ncbi:RidA family protein [Aeromicrobium sp. YIM 150415]|uniref:RidA family protein n=1 Tax=Aeromicrobium piscarium TaxID=2590901 RepID=A0A554RP52_9ACTN|nr:MULTISPECIES: RidA family protein [Aeromicrobium]MBM9464023.1 RidA family protein [Aeromicrobium sp. YIM 150415]TSD55834.1 RidA family protein [Aeromicrobium piscarium]
MTAINSPEVAEPPRPDMFSNARLVGGQLFLSGLHAGDGSGGVLGDGSTYDQARQTFIKIRHLVEAAGGVMDDLVTLRIYLTDIGEKAEVGRARAEFFSGDFPCSTLVEVSALVDPVLTVEIEAQGVLGSAARR